MIAWALVALPAITAALLFLVSRWGTLTALLAAASSLGSLGLALAALPRTAKGASPFAEDLAVGPGRVMGGLDLPFALSLSSTAVFLVVVVSLVVAAVQVYSAWFLGEDARRGGFHTTVALFSAAMTLLVLSSDLFLTIVGWEVMGWCSYLLIGHWSGRPGPRRAAHSSFMVTRIADVGFLLGMAVLVAGARSSSRAAVLEHWGGAGASGLHDLALTAALVLLVIGVLGKAAQLPFHNWLLDAMEGPTPASALIHAATMVAAGTIVLARLLPLLTEDGGRPARLLLGVVVSVTMVLAALCALLEPDLKRLLAWSTISQVGVMLAPLAVAGTGALGGALGHLYGHAIFKALLFLVIGWLGLTRGSTRIADLVGAARQHPVALGAWAAGLASLAGVPMLLGGMSKEDVVATASDGQTVLSRLVLVALLVTAVLSAAYASHALLVTATGDEQDGRQHAVLPPAIAVVLGVLGLLSILGGLALRWLPEAAHVPLPLFGGLVLAVLLGIGLGWLLHTRLGPEGLPRVGARVGAGLGVDTLYRVVLVRPVLALARLVAHLDRDVLDSYVGGLTRAALGGSALGERTHRRARPVIGLTLVGLGLLGAAGITVLVVGVTP